MNFSRCILNMFSFKILKKWFYMCANVKVDVASTLACHHVVMCAHAMWRMRVCIISE